MKNVIVIGAGGSKPYGFPLGSELRDLLVEGREFPGFPRRELLYSSDLFEAFTAAFVGTGSQTVDEFIALRSDFAAIARQETAKIILAHERSSFQSNSLFSQVSNVEKWYCRVARALSAKIRAGSAGDLAIVTFNYDRSLEFRLAVGLRDGLNISLDEAVARLQNIPIYHVYGSLGSLRIGSPDFVPYGGMAVNQEFVSVECIRDSAARLSFSSAQMQNGAFNAIGSAESVLVLGFGYAMDNVNRIGLNGLLRRVPGVHFRSSAIGMSPRQRIVAARSLGALDDAADELFLDKTCGQMISEFPEMIG